MASAGSVTRWLRQLEAGDRSAAQRLWERYFRQLVRLAGQKLRGLPRRAADEEDVALSAFASFCRGAEQARFPWIVHRDSLWQILVTIVTRKALLLVRREQRQKRGGGTWPGRLPSAAPEQNPEGVLGRELPAELAVQAAEECQRLLTSLGDADLRSIALWKMEGYTNDEIAAQLGCVPRTVERRLRVIRSIWNEEGKP